MPKWLTNLLAVSGVITAAGIITLGIFLAVNQSNDSDQSDAIARVVRANTKLIRDAHRDTLDNCERTNEARRASVRNLRRDRSALRSDLLLLRSFPPGASPLMGQAIGSKRRAIRAKTAAVKGSLRSIADVAVEPGSPIVDCAKAYGLETTSTSK